MKEIYRQITEQNQFLAFMDCFRVFGWITLAMIPLVLAIRKFKPGGAGPSVY
jgi:DHA2 family multidrug resistance protein